MMTTILDVRLQMLSLLEHMYHELQIVKEFNINPITLKRWLVGRCRVQYVIQTP